MLNANARKWVEALESGVYRQTKHALHVSDGKGNDSFCCLGVACDIYQKEHDSLEVNIKGHDKPGHFTVVYDGADAYLPKSVREWLGLDSPLGVHKQNRVLVSQFNENSHHTCLSSANDNGVTFKEIANIIRNNSDYLFVDSGSPASDGDRAE